MLDAHGADAFGKPIATASDPYDGFGAQYGYYTDHETGFELVGRRFYDPKEARFMNRDPLGYGGGFNLFRYCGNSPLSNADPSGEGPTLAQTAAGYLNALGGVLDSSIGSLCGTKRVLAKAISSEVRRQSGIDPAAQVLMSGTALGTYFGRPARKNLAPAILDGVSTGSHAASSRNPRD